MSTLSKVTLGFVAIAALCFFYFAARTLRTHEAWRSAAKKHEDAIAALAIKTEAMIAGNPEQQKQSLSQLEVALHQAIAGRGRVWRNVAHRTNQGAVVATVDVPDPHQITEGMVLQAFEMSLEQPTAKYMGEFKVTQANAKDIALEPTVNLFPFQVERINQSRAPWALYETVPADSNDVYDGLTEQELAALLPRPPQRAQGETEEEFQARQSEYRQLVQEYHKDGKQAAPDDPPERVQVRVKLLKSHDQLDQNAKLALDQLKIPPEVIKEGQVLKFDLPTAEQIVQLGIGQEVERVYQRQLREYSLVLREMARQLPLLVDSLEAATDENKAAVAALADAKMHETFNKEEIAKLETELDRLQGEAKAVAEYRGSLEANLAAVKARIDELFAQNRELADKLSQAQLQSAQRAERATAAARPGAR